jgi:hypothetical protein
MKRIILAFLAGAVVAACGDNLSTPRDAMPDDAATPIDAPVDASPPAVGPCLDRPTDLPRPSTGQLPCELLPPGFGT